MIIDAHQHFWWYDAARFGWINESMQILKRDYLPPDLEREFVRTGVDASIAVQAGQSEQETDFLLELAAVSPQIAGVVGWIDLTSPRIEENLRHYAACKKLRGFRHIVQDEPDDRYLLREEVLRGIQQLDRFGYTYDILIYPRQLPAALELVSHLPQQKFVIDHLAKPDIKSRILEPWASQMRAVAKYPNVYCKLSGLVTEANWQNWSEKDFRPYLDVAWDAFRPSRLMFGSDWPVCLLAASYSEVKNVIDDYLKDCAAAERTLVFGETAAHFYGLESGRP